MAERMHYETSEKKKVDHLVKIYIKATNKQKKTDKFTSLNKKKKDNAKNNRAINYCPM
ncbi:hypothetical protein OGW21_07050 [Citrobacter sp. CK190]|uniref:hypothetical protein n=1 Tax=Citrobacter TaxID=544 RepID=UPI001359C640|nr:MULTISPECIES: hypothetical protein [Citrobacter]MBJ9172260.1 hypothetical protein [Citrobacter koseri]MDM2990089.1 hypothetical protein [Citrobacter sp. CK190]WEE16666.1 hypothetical protein PX343_18910 [Citrobacter koseri]WQD97001.1 hypothetical protein U0009_17965 [Citrobacter koseri]HCR9739680.1 hypothetical protein [Citrobacter koseri]